MLDQTELEFLEDFINLLRTSHYRMLTQEEWETATEEEYTVSKGVLYQLLHTSSSHCCTLMQAALAAVINLSANQATLLGMSPKNACFTNRQQLNFHYPSPCRSLLAGIAPNSTFQDNHCNHTLQQYNPIHKLLVKLIT